MDCAPSSPPTKHLYHPPPHWHPQEDTWHQCWARTGSSSWTQAHDGPFSTGSQGPGDGGLCFFLSPPCLGGSGHSLQQLFPNRLQRRSHWPVASPRRLLDLRSGGACAKPRMASAGTTEPAARLREGPKRRAVCPTFPARAPLQPRTAGESAVTTALGREHEPMDPSNSYRAVHAHSAPASLGGTTHTVLSSYKDGAFPPLPLGHTSHLSVLQSTRSGVSSWANCWFATLVTSGFFKLGKMRQHLGELGNMPGQQAMAPHQMQARDLHVFASGLGHANPCRLKDKSLHVRCQHLGRQHSCQQPPWVLKELEPRPGTLLFPFTRQSTRHSAVTSLAASPCSGHTGLCHMGSRTRDPSCWSVHVDGLLVASKEAAERSHAHAWGLS